MADFVYDIGDQIGEFEVVSRTEVGEGGELQYTIISKAHADERRRVAEENRKAAEAAENATAETPAEDAAPAEASEEPETLQPKS